MANIKPLGARVLVKRVSVEEQKSAGGVFIPGAANEAGVYKAEVVEIGPKCEGPAEVGSLVLLTQFAGDRTFEGAEELLLVDEEDLLALVDRS